MYVRSVKMTHKEIVKMNTFIFLLDIIVWPLTVIIVIAILCSHIRKRDFLETKEREQDKDTLRS